MNGAQRAAFNEMVRIADQMSDVCYGLSSHFHSELANHWHDYRETMRNLQQQWNTARNRYFELEYEAGNLKASAHGRTRKRGTQTQSWFGQ